MRLWTIQHAARLEQARWPMRASARRVDPYMLPAYRWMAAQLAARVPPPRGVALPIWAWPGKPDLRGGRWFTRGTPGVRWRRIFGFDRSARDPRRHGPRADVLVQVVLWQVRRDQVVRIERFTAR